MANLKKTENSFIRGGFGLLVAFGFFSFANFLYHFFTARVLGPADYSIIASLFSLIYLIAIGAQSIQTTITKFVSEFKAKKEYGKINSLFSRSLKKISLYAIIIFVVFMILSPITSWFLHVPLTPVLITGISVIFAILLPINRGFLQGLQKFGSLGMNMVYEGLLKILVVVLLVYLGFRVNGAMSAVAISIMAAFVLSFIPLKPLITKKRSPVDSKRLYKYSGPVIFTMLSITALYSFDLLLVKHFLSPLQAGHYSALSLLGKIIFFGATSIALIMFPKSVELFSKKKETKGILMKSLAFVMITGTLTIGIYHLFSEEIISILFGASYLPVANLLSLFGLFMLLLSLIYILALYKLSIEKKKFVVLLGAFNILEIGLIWVFHNSILQILIMLNILSFTLLLLLSIFLYKTFKGVKR
ncbi:oligosaccharide flippase family protein [Nanoarchaeota archaeon]